MMRRRTLLSVVSVVMVRLAAVGVVAAQEIAVRPSIAMADVAISPGSSTLPPTHIGGTISELMMAQLVASQRFQVYDGQWLVPTDEAGRPNLARLRAAAAEHNVDYLLLGRVTAFDTDQKKKRFGGLLPKPLLLGAFTRDYSQVRIGLSFRLVDVRTGEIVSTASGDGVSTRRGLKIGGGGLVKGLPLGVLSSTTRAALPRDAMLSEALIRAVQWAAKGLITATLQPPPR
jgi:curli biogenesis system outer membrane secretion channel CsgG